MVFDTSGKQARRRRQLSALIPAQPLIVILIFPSVDNADGWSTLRVASLFSNCIHRTRLVFRGFSRYFNQFNYFDFILFRCPSRKPLEIRTYMIFPEHFKTNIFLLRKGVILMRSSLRFKHSMTSIYGHRLSFRR